MVERFGMTVLGGCVLVLAMGCSGDTASTPGGGGAGDVDATLAQINDMVRSYCDCMAAGPERETCLGQVDAEAITVNACQRELLASGDGQQLVECVGGLIDDLDPCIQAAGCDQTAFEACGGDLDSGMGACLAASPIAEEMQACDTAT